MAKLYTKKKNTNKDLKPNPEVVSFLLNYSKALTVLKTEQASFEFVKN